MSTQSKGLLDHGPGDHADHAADLLLGVHGATGAGRHAADVHDVRALADGRAHGGQDGLSGEA